KKGKAYVDHSSAEDMDRMKKAGEASPFRDRLVEENLELFEQMKNGELDEGTCVLRAKIDMQAENWLLRDPILYRIKKAHHHRTGDKWNIYPMYDFAHGQSDAIEGITHSLCTLEFEVHRPVYEWLHEEIDTPNRPQQIEFSRLNVAYTVTSKRKLKELIELEKVAGWDDPRLHTIAALRRRGYTPEAINDFIDRAGISKREQQIDLSSLEFSVREDLNKKAPRVMAVLNPIKLVITNYPEGQVEHLGMINNPEDDSQGSREVPFSRELWIERDDFMENPPPPKKFYRLGPDRKVRLKGAYIVHCDSYEKDETGNITTVYCTYFPDSKSGEDTSGIKVKGTIHWVCEAHAKDVEVRLYDRLFTDPNPVGHKDTDYKEFLNPQSLEVITAKAEPHLAEAKTGEKFQFLRKGYFVVDPDSTDDHLVFNRTVTLRDNWKKKQ
ncbi:MAG: glutamine--tRNA ligase, partial [Bacteroidota bacterium]